MKKDNTRLKKFVKREILESTIFGGFLGAFLLSAFLRVAIEIWPENEKYINIKNNAGIQYDRYTDSLIRYHSDNVKYNKFIDSTNKYSHIYNALIKH